MIKDLKKQERTILIKIKQTGYKTNLDDLVDGLIQDIVIICKQRNLKGIKIKIIIK